MATDTHYLTVTPNILMWMCIMIDVNQPTSTCQRSLFMMTHLLVDNMNQNRMMLPPNITHLLKTKRKENVLGRVGTGDSLL